MEDENRKVLEYIEYILENICVEFYENDNNEKGHFYLGRLYQFIIMGLIKEENEKIKSDYCFSCQRNKN